MNNLSIYAYRTKDEKEGAFKVGMTTKKDVAAYIRKDVQGKHTNEWLEKQELDIRFIGECPVSDHKIHEYLRNLGADKIDKSHEWINFGNKDPKTTLTKLIEALKNDNIDEFYELKDDLIRTKTFKPHDYQQNIINKTIEYYNKPENADYQGFLWNVKMRGGKSFMALQLIKQMNLKKILIVSFKVAVVNSWRSDCEEHIDFRNFVFKETNRKDKIRDKSKIEIYFASGQDLFGKEDKKVKEKNKWIFDEEWDMIICDEYHYGLHKHKNKGGRLSIEEDDTYENELSQEMGQENDIYGTIDLPNANKYLYLSGTPFRSLENGEFSEDQIATWTYQEEQEKKEELEKDKSKTNYLADMPKMHIMSYQISDDIVGKMKNIESNEFDLNNFFKATKNGFENEQEVQKFVNSLYNKYNSNEQFIQENRTTKSVYTDLGDKINGSMWYLSNVASCKAMEKLLQKDDYFKDFLIYRAAGSDTDIGEKVLKDFYDKKTAEKKDKFIILSCGKLNTGVTIKELQAIFLLSDLESIETYFQLIFRAQSPWKENNKQECYVFDWAINRTLRLVEDYIDKQVKQDDDKKDKQIGKLLKCLPILAFKEGEMKLLNVNDFYNFAHEGIEMALVRRITKRKTLNLSNQILQEIFGNKALLEELMKIEAYKNFDKSVSMRIKQNNELSKAQRKEDNVEEKKVRENIKKDDGKKDSLVNKLLHINNQLLTLLYATEYREKTLTDVIEMADPNYFFEMVGLQKHLYYILTDIGLFNKEELNAAIMEFRRLENNSLQKIKFKYDEQYGDDENEKIGLFNKTIDLKSLKKMGYSNATEIEKLKEAMGA